MGTPVETRRAVIVPVDPHQPPDTEQIVDWCRTRLASYKKPTSVVVVAALPRNASGKEQKTVLRERYGQPAG
jgi:acyl-CoA synthetase (AMP-forming)/AMP-acid ligase II